MANKNNTRVGNIHEKKGVCRMVVEVNADSYKEYADASNNYLVGLLPADAIIEDAYVFTKVASDALAVTLGTAEAGTEIMSAGDSATLGGTGTFTGKSDTGSGVEVHMTLGAAATTGDFIVVIEYTEYTLNTGDLTRII